jgi:hypothetical protein
MALSVILLACNTAGSVKEPWHIEMTSSGGFTGRGVGTVNFDSDGAPEGLRRAVADSKPQHWESEYTHKDAPHGYPDEVHYTLTLTAGDHRYVTSWHETAKLPRDLDAIREALRSAK